MWPLEDSQLDFWRAKVCLLKRWEKCVNFFSVSFQRIKYVERYLKKVKQPHLIHLFSSSFSNKTFLCLFIVKIRRCLKHHIWMKQLCEDVEEQLLVFLTRRPCWPQPMRLPWMPPQPTWQRPQRWMHKQPWRRLGNVIVSKWVEKGWTYWSQKTIQGKYFTQPKKDMRAFILET